MRVLLAILAAALLAGCSSAPNRVVLNEETAREAPARLEADMGPNGAMSSSDGTMRMSMAIEGEGESMTMDMTMDMDLDYYKEGAFLMEVRFTRFEATGAPEGQEMPDMSGLVLRMFCAPDRWVLETEGFEDLSDGFLQDADHETRNSKGDCAMASEGNVPDLARLMQAWGGQEGMMGMDSTLMSGMQTPNLEFVRLDGATARYRVTGMEGMDMMQGMDAGPIFMNATFDSQGRIDHSDMRMGMSSSEMGMQMEMTMDMEMDYTYATRSSAPDVQGTTQV